MALGAIAGGPKIIRRLGVSPGPLASKGPVIDTW
jgi:hypothetical protein